MATVVYNRTKYSDETLREAADFAHRICGVKGEVAVIVRYHAHSTGFLGLMHSDFPFFHDVANDLKKFQDKKHILKIGDFNPDCYDKIRDHEVAMATSDGAFGYITVRMPKAKKYLTASDAERVMETIFHEMEHINQYRDKEWALEDSGSPDWSHFLGYSSRNAARRVTHQKRPIERHVNKLLKDLKPKLARSIDYQMCVEGLRKEFTSPMVMKKVSKQKVKYNKYGERMSDYRNVKMKTLRNGDEIVTCPCCGEQAVTTIGDYRETVYTHIAAVSDEVVRFGYLSAAEARYTQFGHMVDDDGNLIGVVEFGYRVSEPSDSPFKVFNYSMYSSHRR